MISDFFGTPSSESKTSSASGRKDVLLGWERSREMTDIKKILEEDPLFVKGRASRMTAEVSPKKRRLARAQAIG